MLSLGRDVLAAERAADLRREAEHERLIRVVGKEGPNSGMGHGRTTRSPRPSPSPQPARSLPVPSPRLIAALPVTQGSGQA
jgi:hypothetical protein